MDWKIDEYINENTAFPDISGQTEVTVDFENNKFINSLGISEWIKWISAANSSRIVLLNVSSSFMHQAATVASMITENCAIKSFKVPIYSETAQQEKEILLQLDSDVDFDSQGDFLIKKDMNFDDVDDWEVDVVNDQYFDLIRHQLEVQH